MVAIMLHVLLVMICSSLVLGGPLDNDKYPMENGREVIKGGERQTGDEKLFSELAIEKGKPFQQVGNEYCYPKNGSTDQVKITSYEVRNLDKGDDGGLAFDVSGGVGQPQVCVFLKTKYGKSYNFKIDVYGFRGNNGAFGTTSYKGSGYENYGGFGIGSYGIPNNQGSGNGGYGSGRLGTGYGGGNNINNYYGGNGIPFGNFNPIYPAYGNNNPAYGNNNPAYGNNNPAYGNNNPAYGNSYSAYGISSDPFNQGYNDQGRNNYSPGGGLLSNDKYPMENGRDVIKGGERQTGDEKLYSEQAIERGEKFRHIGNEYCYPKKGTYDQVKITSYEVRNLDKGDDGGLAFDVSGGVGQSQVCVFLKTRYGKSYNFKIDVYGFRGNNGGFGTGHFGGVGPDSYVGSGNGNYGSGLGTGYGGGNNMNNFDGRNSYPSYFNNPSSGTMYPYLGANNPTFGNYNPSVGPNNPTFGNYNPSVGPNNPTFGNYNPSVGPNNLPLGMKPPAYGNINTAFGTYSPAYGNTGPQGLGSYDNRKSGGKNRY